MPPDHVEVWLLRHGEIASYEGDHGLTERGAAQAARAARLVAEELVGESGAVPHPLRLRHATSVRASETACHLAGALTSHGIALDGPRDAPGFDNVAVAFDGEVHPHDSLRARTAQLRVEHPLPPTSAPEWWREGHRFAYIHDGGGDPIRWWLTQPCLAYEPPARVVRRFWRALAELAAEGLTPAVVCTHSAAIRALAAEAAGRDLGEPANLEALRVRLGGSRTGDPASVEYRGEIVELAIPELREPAWP
jgi:broad specificity phosphatase PhoE